MSKDKQLVGCACYEHEKEPQKDVDKDEAERKTANAYSDFCTNNLKTH